MVPPPARRVPPFWWPPGRIFRQAASAGLIALQPGQSHTLAFRIDGGRL